MSFGIATSPALSEPEPDTEPDADADSEALSLPSSEASSELSSDCSECSDCSDGSSFFSTLDRFCFGAFGFLAAHLTPGFKARLVRLGAGFFPG